MKNSPSLPVRGGLSRQRGWRMPSNTAKVYRPGRLGNPHKAGVAPLQLSANEAIVAYEADHLYLVTEPEIVVPHEVPVGWGWLVREGEALFLRQAPVRQRTTVALRGRWLEQVALAGMRSSRGGVAAGSGA